MESSQDITQAVLEEISSSSPEDISLKIIKFIDLWLSYPKEDNSLDLSFMQQFVEPLKDSFDTEKDIICMHALAEIVQSSVNRSEKMKNWFKELKIEEKSISSFLIERYKKVIADSLDFTPDQKTSIKKLIILSRATLGADVLVIGTILTKTLREFPNANIVFVDSMGIADEIFSNPRIKAVTSFNNGKSDISLRWNRKSFSLIERLEYAKDLSDFISQETINLNKEDWLVIDASTRLSQTGLMPICPIENYLFIPTFLTKEESSALTKKDYRNILTLGETLNQALNKSLNSTAEDYTKLYVNSKYKLESDRISSVLSNLDKPIIFVNFKGEPPSKSLSLDFEKKLLNSLVSTDNAVILIRSPNEKEEKKNITLIEFCQKNGTNTQEITDKIFDSTKSSTNSLYTYKGELGLLVSLIERANLYIGYDSLGQHIAAAVNTPNITLFAGHINKVFLRRWTPYGPGIIKVIEVDKKQGLYESSEAFRIETDSQVLKETISQTVKLLKDYKSN